ncbi:MAG: hypothetical protein IKZ95_08335 [Lachnospiraceae bacterium]|nr:hypothetical protein [Lachnospiraceae bacterium]
MMMSPQTYKDLHQDDSYEELLAERESLLEAIADFEQNYDETKPFMYPSPQDKYLFNLEYLAELCALCT